MLSHTLSANDFLIVHQIYEIEAFDESNFNSNLPDVVQHQRVQDIIDPDLHFEHHTSRSKPQRPPNGPRNGLNTKKFHFNLV